MAVYKDQERGTWYAKFSYKDRYGNTRWTTKRGFKTPEEAKRYEASFKRTSVGGSNMTFDMICALYKEKFYPAFSVDTICMKDNAFNTFILPYFTKEKPCEVSALEVGYWEKIVRDIRDPQTGECYPEDYLQSVFALFGSLLELAASV